MKNKLKLLDKSTIALVLVVISFIMLLFPWIGISVESYGYKIPLSRLLEQFGIHNSQLEPILQRSVTEVANETMPGFAAVLNLKKAVKITCNVLSGKLSLPDVAQASGYISSLAREMKDILLFMNDTSYVDVSELTTASRGFGLLAIGVWAVMAIAVGLFVVALLSLLKKRKTGAIVYSAFLCVLFVALFIILAIINSNIRLYSDWIFEEMYRLAGILAGAQGYLVLGMTGTAWLSVLCAVAAVLVMVVDWKEMASKLTKKPIVVPPDLTKWTCPVCSRKNSFKNTFCPECGSKRPEKPRCECGAILKPGARFCVECGRAAITIDPIPSDVPERCPVCGSIMINGVCEKCSKPKAYCERCGSPVDDGERICKECRQKTLTGGMVAPGDDDL